MKHVHIHLVAGQGSSRSSNLLGVLLMALVLLCIVLLVLGLWLLLAVGIVFMIIAALVRALLPRHRRRPTMIESHADVHEGTALVVDGKELQRNGSSHIKEDSGRRVRSAR